MTRKKLMVLALAGTALAPVCSALAAPALPTGGKVVAGSAVIGTPSGGSMTVRQSTGKAIIDWSGFSIGQGAKVAFQNGSGATLNRVTGTSVSSLDGLLTGTGSVYLINPNGVIIGRSGVVSVGGTFVASTLETADAAFLKGGPLALAGDSAAEVVNYGRIGSLGGDVALVASRVANAGTITAANGDVGLLAGASVRLTDASLDDGRFSVLLGGAGTRATNSGLIAAADAELRAEGGNVYALAGDTAGVIRATGVAAGGGRVWLVAEGGALALAGAVEATGANGTAGAIETSGGEVSLGHARVDAHGGTWLVDPYDLTIDGAAAASIDAALNAGTSVVEQTSAAGSSGAGTADPNGSGDIIVASNISWSSTAALTLSAYRNIELAGAYVTASGGGTLHLVTDNSGAGNGGALGFSGVGSVQFTGRSNGQPTGALTIGSGTGAPTGYTLVADLTTLAGDIAANNSGAYALAGTVDGSNGGVAYTASPLASTVTTPFAGVLEGLGNQVQNLTIADPTNGAVGLFGRIGPAGVVQDLLVNTGAITGTSTSALQSIGALAGVNAGSLVRTGADYVTLSSAIIANVGGLVGANSGMITASTALSTVSGGEEATAGGLAGANSGRIAGSHAQGSVSGPLFAAGGLVGSNDGGVLDGDDATGVVSTTRGSAGGLAGVNETPYQSSAIATITNSYATGDVDGEFAGGLVGTAGGVISASFATGAVLTGGTTASVAGGLIGSNSGTVTGSYATGSVGLDPAYAGTQDDAGVGGLAGQNTGTLNAVYATGDVTGSLAGGLVGANAGGTIVDAYATGAVRAEAALGFGAREAGGLAGLNYGAISDAYATGAVSGAAGASVGGLVGYDESGFGGAVSSSITDVYATGSVTGGGGGAVGGLVGSVFAYGQPASITRAYATGVVFGLSGDAVGGFAGSLFGGSITGSLWDRTATGQTAGVGSGMAAGLASVQDDDPTAADYAFATAPYTAAGFSFGGLGSGATWVVVDADGGLNGAGGALAGTRPMLLGEYATTVANAHQLQLMALDPTAAYTLAGDVDATGTAGGDVWGAGGFVPVGGNAAAAFGGTFDGGGYGVYGLTINSTVGPSSTAGLFGQANGTLSNVSVEGSATGLGEVGLLVGLASGTIRNASADGQSSGAIAGGLAGALNGAGAITASASDAAVMGSSSIGGLVGSLFGAGTSVAGSYATGSVTLAAGGVRAGGLAGLNEGAISGSYATGAVDASAAPTAAAGGLVGDNVSVGEGPATITTAYATGTVHGGAAAPAGGLVGDNGAGARVTQSYATGAILSDGGAQANGQPTYGLAGGFVGVNYGVIADAYAIGATGQGLPTASLGYLVREGGFVAENEGSITGAWASGAVAANGTVGAGLGGGFAELNNETITAAYYDQGTTAQASGVAQGDGSGVGAVGGATGLSPYAAASYPNLPFGTTPGGAAGQAFVIVDTDSTLNNAGGVAGGTRPFLLSEWSLNVANSHQLELANLTPYPIGFGLVYTQTADINLSATRASIAAPSADMWAAAGFVPIGQAVDGRFVPVPGGSLYVDDGFFNAYEGQGYTISNLYIDNLAVPDVGLFGEASGPTGGSFPPGATIPIPSHYGVSDVTLLNASVTGAGSVGALAGAAVTVVGARVAGTVTGVTQPGYPPFVGGIIGQGLISASYSDVAVSGGDNAVVGGVTGLSEGTFSSRAVGVVSGGAGAEVGGVVGDAFVGGLFDNVSSAGVAGGAGASVGGVAGWEGSGFTFGNYATGPVSGGAGSLVGGFAGRVLVNALEFDNYATGTVAATGGGAKAGGYAGQVDSGATVEDAYALGAVSGGGSDGAGGLGMAAGFAGSNAGTLTSVYATGKVSGGGDGLSTLAGLVGANTGSVSQGFWDVQTTGQLLDAAASPTPATGSTGLTTAQFMDPTSPISGLGLATTSTGLGSSFVIVDVDGSFNGAGGAAGATRPFLVSEASGLITNLHQLQLVGLNPYGLTSQTFELENDIDATPTADANPSDMWGPAGFVPIGSGATPFSGSFEGFGATITGLTVNRSGSYAGLFGALSAGGVVQDLTLAGAKVTGGGYVGGVVGDNAGRLANVTFEGQANGPSGVGGLVGVNEGGAFITGSGVNAASVAGSGNDVGGIAGANFGIVVGSSSVAAVFGVDHVGGLVGYNAGQVKDSLEYGAVQGRDYVGGVVGLNFGLVAIDVAYAPMVTGAQYVGGVVGWNDVQLGNAEFSDPNTGALYGDASDATTVSASGDYAGGLAGVNKGVVSDSDSTSSVSGAGLVGGLIGLNQGYVLASQAHGDVGGNRYLGGLVGWNDTGAIIRTSYATGAVTGVDGGQDAFGNDYVGGLVGVNFGSIADTYATGAVSGVQVVGGLVGTNMPGGASVATSYATGPVSASQYIAGSTFGVQAGEVTNVYGFPSFSGQPLESGYDNTPSATGDGVDLTPAQLNDPSAYVGFDFDTVWQANDDGPPTLKRPPG